MNQKELLIDTLKYYHIEIIKQTDQQVFLDRNYDIEIEPNGIYKLRCDGQVIAPFEDLDELCRFVLY